MKAFEGMETSNYFLVTLVELVLLPAVKAFEGMETRKSIIWDAMDTEVASGEGF